MIVPCSSEQLSFTERCDFEVSARTKSKRNRQRTEGRRIKERFLVSADRSNRNKSVVRQTGSRIAWARHGVRTRPPCVRERGPGGEPYLFRGTRNYEQSRPSLCREEMYRQMFFTCQVQYLNDVDPFSYPTLYPDVNPPDHTFSATLPLINQLAAVHRLLRAPHRVSYFRSTLFYRFPESNEINTWIANALCLSRKFVIIRLRCFDDRFSKYLRLLQKIYILIYYKITYKNWIDWHRYLVVFSIIVVHIRYIYEKLQKQFVI